MIRAVILSIVVLFALAPAPDANAQKPGTTRSKHARKKLPPPAPAENAPDTPQAPAGASDATRTLQRGERVEFDERLIQGQTAKAGAVYLLERASSNLRSMVRGKLSFREKIVRTVYPRAEENEP